MLIGIILKKGKNLIMWEKEEGKNQSNVICLVRGRILMYLWRVGEGLIPMVVGEKSVCAQMQFSR